MKIRLKTILFSAFALTVSLTGCYNDNEEDLYVGSSSCDTSNVTYSATIAPMFASYCNNCHSGGAPSGGILTDTYTSVIENMARIKGCVNHESGYSAMPQNGDKLSVCELLKIDAWINHGMPNN